ncbi:MAG: chemotaxis protein CheB [Azospirillaceae bacterium]
MTNRLQETSSRAPDSGPGDLVVVGIGASAGGLSAFQRLLDAMPPDTGTAFILVQHLDPTHQSMMVDLLSSHTSMTVLQAADGMPIVPDRVYVIPPGVYLSVRDRSLRLTEPRNRHGSRLPFDFLLHSLAAEFGPHAAGIVLSGTGADGSVGLRSLKDAGGLVIVQDPAEADYDGMPRSAIATGTVDQILPVARMPEALVRLRRSLPRARPVDDDATPPQDAPADWLTAIVGILHDQTLYDFTQYKRGTLQRRIERRMAMAEIATKDIGTYLERLRDDQGERDLLAKDLLINVTGFYRDPKVFDLLATEVIPGLVASHPAEDALRVWVAGCSTGEEVYSLAMLLMEQITATRQRVKLQIFASDVDPDAVATAREGHYPGTIEADVSSDRLARFFVREADGYRVTPELRATVVFTVQDLLSDPPFSRIDLISCRNLLIYLQPEAQAKAISLFHFALREGGLLLLGNAETIGHSDDRFEVVSDSGRLFRHVGRRRPGGGGFLMRPDGVTRAAQIGSGTVPSRLSALTELSQRLVVARHAPATTLVSPAHECLYTLGPIDTYLRVGAGQPTNDVLVMAREGVRARLRMAIDKAIAEDGPVSITGGRLRHNGETLAFRIDAEPVICDGETLLLICFLEERGSRTRRTRKADSVRSEREVELQEELDATRLELEGVVRDLERSVDTQKVIAEETLSINEEFQATNEELLTSKEELQSLNEELTALNSQLQETLERERTVSDDLQNILFSTDAATLFLDADLNIRFFTPTIQAHFHVIPGDIGRPIADLSSLNADRTLLDDAREVLGSHQPTEREIETRDGVWHIRRILPYRSRDESVGGVVVTFTDITELKQTAEALQKARRIAEQADLAKSRFLVAASHDLRQPLQALALIQGLLADTVKGEDEKKLVARLGQTSAAMTAMLDTLLDLNRIEAGVVRTEIGAIEVGAVFERLREEFTFLASAQGSVLRIVPCRQRIMSDPALLEQMLRNLLSNAVRYTAHGKILLGCRRRGQQLSIEVWDTGIGIPEHETQRISEEFFQIDNPARERGGGLGLGLSIVQRSAHLLGHKIEVRSKPGHGSVFAIVVSGASELAEGPAAPVPTSPGHAVDTGNAVVLIVEDDPDIRELLVQSLSSDVVRVVVTTSSDGALRAVREQAVRPDIIVTDYNLPNGMNGLRLANRAREMLGSRVPVIILTGDVSAESLAAIADEDVTRLSKPVKLEDLTQAVHRLLFQVGREARTPGSQALGRSEVSDSPIIYVVDDDSSVCREIGHTLESVGWTVETFPSAETFLAAFRPGRVACLLIDELLPGMDGMALLNHLAGVDDRLTKVMITGYGNVDMAVRAMKSGALDFIEKPIERSALIASVERALAQSVGGDKRLAVQREAEKVVSALTPRQREIFSLIVRGTPNKIIAADLQLSQRTVENHRAAIMKKTGAKTLPDLVRLSLSASRSQVADKGDS